MDPIDGLERCYAQLSGVATTVTSDLLSASTPCEGWSVQQALNHTLGAGWMFTKVNEGEQVSPPSPDGPDLVGANPAAAVRELAQANAASWRAAGLDGERTYPFGTFPAQGGLMINIGEVAIHAWDVAQATGAPVSVDSDVATMLLAFYEQMPMDQFRAGGAFGAEVQVAADDTPATRILAFLGRQP
jgi:uncharacterized protein (TIGR03086 family)